MARNNVSERIVKLLSKHPEGLTFAQISREIGMHRNTVTKYLYELSGAGIINIRDMRTLKLCYLEPKAGSKLSKKGLGRGKKGGKK